MAHFRGHTCVYRHRQSHSGSPAYTAPYRLYFRYDANNRMEHTLYYDTPKTNGKEKLKTFLNSMTWDEAREFYRFLRTRTWTQWIDDIAHNRKIQ